MPAAEMLQRLCMHFSKELRCSSALVLRRLHRRSTNLTLPLCDVQGDQNVDLLQAILKKLLAFHSEKSIDDTTVQFLRQKNVQKFLRNDRQNSERSQTNVSFCRQYSSNLFRICSGMLAMSGVFLGHRYLSQKSAESCPLMYLDSKLPEYLRMKIWGKSSLPVELSVLQNADFKNTKLVSNEQKVENEEVKSTAAAKPTDLIDEACANLKKAIDEGNGIILNSLATQLMNAGREKEGFHFFLSASECNHGAAMYNLGLCYEHGLGVEQDYCKAAEYYEKAAERKHAKAMFNLATFHFDGVGLKNASRSEGLRIMKEAADCGLTEAQLFVAKQLRKDKNFLEARAYLHKAAANKNRSALFLLGVSYQNCEEPDSDINKAIQFYEQAASLGHINAQYNLGVIYENGIGVPKDRRQALKWYKEVSLYGDREALDRVEILKFEVAQEEEQLLLQTLEVTSNRLCSKPLSHTTCPKSVSMPTLKGFSESSGRSAFLTSGDSLHRSLSDLNVFRDKLANTLPQPRPVLVKRNSLQNGTRS